ncbi:MAG: asparagine synthetase B, partial [Proteobacteria bacterium]|nr:asparagine synthetase B [Pseudomonadota bacterium]
SWGSTCLARLRGMFAFVVFDKVSRQITCVRDAFGIKPFFYRHDEDGFFFASEVPALLALRTQRPQLNLQRAYDYLVGSRYDDTSESFFDGVRQLLPGHLITLDFEAATIAEHRRWWWPSIAERIDLTFADATEQLRAMFLDNVRLHLRSDVRLGAALSGGVDSSAVVCAMRHVEPEMPIHTFSYVARGSDADEEHWADLVNGHVNAIPHKVLVSSNELAADLGL